MSRRRNRQPSPPNRDLRQQAGDMPAAIEPPDRAETADGTASLPAVPERENLRSWLAAAALVVAVFSAYQPAWHGGFLWDDDLHLLHNPVILRPDGLKQAWLSGEYINYWPLTFTVYWLEYKAWGLDPLGFHLVNIALHAVAALLVWRLLERLRMPGALLAAAIFALHPVNVESVAWIAQLKGLLSLSLGLLSMHFYLGTSATGGWWRLAAAAALFLLSALAKGMVLTLPVVLLGLCLVAARPHRPPRSAAGHPLRAHRGDNGGRRSEQAAHGHGRQRRAIRRTARPRRRGGLRRLVLLLEIIWPANLMFVYPRWNISERDLWAYLPGVCWRSFWRSPGGSAAPGAGRW